MDTMEFDVSTMKTHLRYALLISLITPRPIAFISTLSDKGIPNAAPFSFFNLMGNDPPIVAIGIGKDETRKDDLKDSGLNIQNTKEFVINIVNERILEQVNMTSIDFPPEVDESEIAGLTKLPSIKVKPPRIAESPANLECRLASTVEIGNTRIVLGEIVYLHIKKEFLYQENQIAHTGLLSPVGRMHKNGVYTRTTDLFNLPRISFKEWKEKDKSSKNV
ncbi:MAG: flavin reductase family protein [Candidatus Nitrosocosmicus sp.]|nr:flavin reductase family protein [Candidatus Nitrosocosmicus sp.]